MKHPERAIGARLERNSSSSSMLPLAHSRTRASVLCLVFFLSGASALIFETLWFRLAGLAFGNSLWASALVLSSFMAGLALGNGIAARRGLRVRNPVRAYAILELGVAATGIALVLVLPVLGGFLGPVFRPLLERAAGLNALRFVVSFALLMAPATAMGMTLPLLVRSLLAKDVQLGRILGQLYGSNTLGAVAGALLGETLLIQRFGINGAASCAALLNLLSALGALAVAGGTGAQGTATPIAAGLRLSSRAWRCLGSSFLCGGILLALEVVWFRFLQLFLPGTSLTFAVLLSIVLGGIGVGGIIASLWFRRSPTAARRATAVALGMGIVSILGYGLLDQVLGDRTETRLSSGYGLADSWLCVFLMLPVSLLSGVLFTLLGQAAQEELGDETRSAGLVTMANTVGATIGPLLAGFVLIPRLGMELSFLVLGSAYALVAGLQSHRIHWRAPPRSPLEVGLALVLVLVVCCFPFGRMNRYLEIASAAYRAENTRVVAVREGLGETIQYLQDDFLGEPLFHRLVTNSFSMSSTDPKSRRYMKYYVYWPVAIHPDPRNALLISFGCGSTAKALADTRALESIVVVDISREILDLAGEVVFPEPGTNPLEDPRVEIHVEDGRFFLQSTVREFDLITSEPPPPKLAGVVNLYTREYFQLMRDRLAEGGIATYWLPVQQLTLSETKSIVRAFLDVFGDETTLWNGSGLDWMLVGSRNVRSPVSAEHFARQWADPGVASEMSALGFEHPGQVGATFLMGAEDLRALTAGSAPLTDDDPKLLSSRLGTDLESIAAYATIMNTASARERFESSRYVRRLWPESLRRESADYLIAQEAINRVTALSLTAGELDLSLLHQVLTRTDLISPVLWAHGSDADAQAIIARAAADGAGTREGSVGFHRAVLALAQRQYRAADLLLAEYEPGGSDRRILLTRVYLRCLENRMEEAQGLVEANLEWFTRDPGAQSFLRWLDALGFSVNP